MKYTFAILLLTTLPSLAQTAPAVASPAILEQRYGFRDAQFESDTTAFHDLNQLGYPNDHGRARTYWRTNDPKQIGDAEVEATYTFYKGKLYAIALTTASHSDSQALLQVLTAKYGQGTQDNPRNQHFLWMTKRVSMLFQEGSLTGKGQVYIVSRPLAAQREQDAAADAKKAAGDL